MEDLPNEDDKQEKKISVAVKRETIDLLDEVARTKVNQAISTGSFDIINLIRSKRGRGVSYDKEINYLARIYLAVVNETKITHHLLEKNPELKAVIDRLNEINNFFEKSEQESEEE
ncbi:MAG: hypothetical protein PHH00_02085 [Candidatus Nanoarchaeia archaeon]|nr:hypothetical protein [Candidatus Nanoarchaeia archaeon]